MSTGSYWPNCDSGANSELACCIEHLYLGFRTAALGRVWVRKQIQTVRWRLFQTAGKIVRHGRQVFLKINAAMLDVFTAIRERCARIMQEGGAVPETS
jgi:hypothetical protein